MLRDKPEGGDNWLLGLREVPYKEASAALCTLPGVGPKVAACVREDDARRTSTTHETPNPKPQP